MSLEHFISWKGGLKSNSARASLSIFSLIFPFHIEPCYSFGAREVTTNEDAEEGQDEEAARESNEM